MKAHKRLMQALRDIQKSAQPVIQSAAPVVEVSDEVLRAQRIEAWLSKQPGSVRRGYLRGNVNVPESVLRP